ncbi:MAG: DUF3426 domain-containing protein [Gammaproteobacteria bacterium]
MYTQCPDCTSVFEISPEHLGAAGGMVQCGVCDTTFNALRRLTETPPDEPASQQADFSTTEEQPEDKKSGVKPADAPGHPNNDTQTKDTDDETIADESDEPSAHANREEQADFFADNTDTSDSESDNQPVETVDSLVNSEDTPDKRDGKNEDETSSESDVLEDVNESATETDIEPAARDDSAEDDEAPFVEDIGEPDEKELAEASAADDEDTEAEAETEPEPEPEPVPFDEDITDEVKILEDHSATTADLPDEIDPVTWNPDDGEQELQTELENDELLNNDFVDLHDKSSDEIADDPEADSEDEELAEDSAPDGQNETGVALDNPDDFFSTSQVLEEWDIDEGEHDLEALLADDSLLDEIGIETVTGFVANENELTDDTEQESTSEAGDEDSEEDDNSQSIDEGEDDHESETSSADETENDANSEGENKIDLDGEADQHASQHGQPKHPESDSEEDSDKDEDKDEYNADEDTNPDHEFIEPSDDSLDEQYEAELEELLGEEYLDEDLDPGAYYTVETDNDAEPETDKETQVEIEKEEQTSVAEDDEAHADDLAEDEYVDLANKESGVSDELDKSASDSNALLTQGVDGKFEEDDADDLKDLGDYLSPTKSLVRRLGEGLIVLLLIGGLAGQYVHYNRNELATHPEYGTHVQNVYAKLGKNLRANWQVSDYRVARHTIVPNDEDTSLLLARATIVNNTSSERPLPLLRLKLKNRWGDSIYGRVFSPNEYLNETPPGSLAGDGRLEVSLDLVHPAPEEEIGYSFDVCLDTPDGPDCGTPQIFNE